MDFFPKDPVKKVLLPFLTSIENTETAASGHIAEKFFQPF